MWAAVASQLRARSNARAFLPRTGCLSCRRPLGGASAPPTWLERTKQREVYDAAKLLRAGGMWLAPAVGAIPERTEGYVLGWIYGKTEPFGPFGGSDKIPRERRIKPPDRL